MHKIHSFDDTLKNNKIYQICNKLQINALQTEFINTERIVKETNSYQQGSLV